MCVSNIGFGTSLSLSDLIPISTAQRPAVSCPGRSPVAGSRCSSPKSRRPQRRVVFHSVASPAGQRQTTTSFPANVKPSGARQPSGAEFSSPEEHKQEKMKHSHDRSSFGERVSGVLSNSEEREAASVRFGRKVLPDIIDNKPVREGQKEQNDKENLKIVRQVSKPENDDKNRSTSDQEMDSKDQGRTEEGASLPDGKTKKGVASVVLEEEHDGASHEAREKSFRGDDASSEVFHNSQVAEHEEASHEAQERRFNGDDASSAVEHIVTTKESESAEDRNFKGDSRLNIIEHFTEDHESESAEERNFRSDDGSTGLENFTEEKEFESEDGARNLDEKLLENIANINREAEDTSRVDSTGDSSVVELLDTSEGSNSSPSKSEDDSLANNITTANVTTPGTKDQELDPVMLEEISASAAINNQTVIAKEQYPDVKATETKQQIYPRNSIGNQTEIAMDSIGGSKDQDNLKINSSALSQGQIREEVLINVTSNMTYPQDQLSISHIPQAQHERIIIPGENYSFRNNVSEASDVPQKADMSANAEEMVKSSKTPSTTKDDGKGVPLETNKTLPTQDQKEEQGDNYPSNLQNIQNKVNFPNLEASE